MNGEVERDRMFFVRRALAVVVGGAFVYAGALKALNPLLFATDIGHYQMLTWPIAVRVAFYLPWLEIFCGLALIFHRLFFGALVVTIGLMIAFLIATVTAKARGIDITCGCFGSATGNLSFSWHLALDFVLLAILGFLWWKPLSPSPARA
ncbi:MAG: MauE/DoxX family redox-associated membrane protein [Chthoniobacterales bacterium]